MSEKTNIAWCDSTVNFWSGCTKVSAGCANCYAEARDARMMQEKVIHWGKGAPRLKHNGAVKSAMAFNRKPWICDGCGHASNHHDTNICGQETNGIKCFCRHQHRRRIFSLSLGDWLDEEVPLEWLAEMLDTIRQCDNVIWILCSKRPENFKERLTRVMIHIENSPETKQWTATWKWVLDWVCGLHESSPSIPENIILLASVENQAMADLRIPQLLAIPAACRGLSLEPLLGPVNLDMKVNWGGKLLRPVIFDLDWLIIGGESGSNARTCNVDWIRSIAQYRKSTNAAIFIKQLGSKPQMGREDSQIIRDKKGGDINEWPNDLRIQEWPNMP